MGRPDPVTNLRLEGGQVKWEWSENAFDLGSPGSCSERPLQIKDNVLEWSGPVQKTAKPKRRSPEPTKVLAETERLRAQDLELKDGRDREAQADRHVRQVGRLVLGRHIRAQPQMCRHGQRLCSRRIRALWQ